MEGEEWPLPRIQQPDVWRRMALNDLKRRRERAGDILRGARVRKGQRVVLSEDEDEQQR